MSDFSSKWGDVLFGTIVAAIAPFSVPISPTLGNGIGSLLGAFFD